MREVNGKWKYVALYVDDLAFALHDPKFFVKLLKDKYKYILKGIGEIAFHLDWGFFWDNTGDKEFQY